MEKLYRFMSLESFLDTILRNSLTFVNPSLWEDPYEQHVYKILAENEKNNALSLVLSLAPKSIFAQSWTNREESDALWRIYSHNNSSIRITVTKENISKLHGVVTAEVEYSDTLLKSNPVGNLLEHMSVKRVAFKHEEEVRLYCNDEIPSTILEKFKYSDLNENGELKEEKVTQFLRMFPKKSNTKKVSFENIAGFIEEVMLNPFAPDWVNETLEIFCEKYKLNYLGKSKLYKIIEKS